MTQILEAVLPTFGLIALGYGSTRLGILAQSDVRGLVLFAFNFSIPSLLLTSVASLDLAAGIDWRFLGAFYAASLVVYGLGMAWGGVGLGRGLPGQGIFGMAAAFSNLVLIGVPIVLTTLGPDASLPMLAIIGFHSATFMPLTVVLLLRGGAAGSLYATLLRSLGEILRNPIILGILIGFLVNVVGVSLPGPVSTGLDFLGAAAIPCALFAVGGSLAAYPLLGGGWSPLLLSSLKLVVHPALVWVVAVPVLGLEGMAVSVAVLMAAMPTAVNVYLFGAAYDTEERIAARTVLFSTAAAAVTIPLVLLALGV